MPVGVEAETFQAAAKLVTSLTEREQQQVMLLAVEGLHNKEIARSLGISHRTVEIHKAHIMHKTGAATLLDLARLAEAGGLRDQELSLMGRLVSSDRDEKPASKEAG